MTDDISPALHEALVDVLVTECEKLKARVVELESELRSFAEAKFILWDDGYNNPSDFAKWVQSRSRHILNHK